MLYYLATWKWPFKLHSAQTLWIGLTLYAFLTNNKIAFLIVILLRIILYLYRQIKYNKIANLIPLIRISLVLLSCLLIIYNQHYILSILPLVIGEIIDRVEFYNELSVPNPEVEFALRN